MFPSPRKLYKRSVNHSMSQNPSTEQSTKRSKRTGQTPSSLLWGSLQPLPDSQVQVDKWTFQKYGIPSLTEAPAEGGSTPRLPEFKYKDLPEILQKATCLRTLRPLFETSKDKPDLSEFIEGRKQFYQLRCPRTSATRDLDATFYPGESAGTEMAVLFLSEPPPDGKVATDSAISRIKHILTGEGDTFRVRGVELVRHSVPDPSNADARLVTYGVVEDTNVMWDEVSQVKTKVLLGREFKHFKIDPKALESSGLDESRLNDRFGASLDMLIQATCVVTMAPMFGEANDHGVEDKRDAAFQAFLRGDLGFWEHVVYRQVQDPLVGVAHATDHIEQTHLFIREEAHSIPTGEGSTSTGHPGLPAFSGLSVSFPIGHLTKCQTGQDISFGGREWKSRRCERTLAASNTKHVCYEYAPEKPVTFKDWLKRKVQDRLKPVR